MTWWFEFLLATTVTIVVSLVVVVGYNAFLALQEIIAILKLVKTKIEGKLPLDESSQKIVDKLISISNFSKHIARKD